ncbi:MAG: hypothetical protein GY817_09435 [bacterium]|nr:hypothetical protein [bacterium]
MESKEILKIANKVYPKIRTHYGLGKKEYPPIEVYRNIFARLSGEPDMEGDDPADAEFDRKTNKLFIYSDFNNSIEDVIRGVIHEYIHYLQSGSWMKRYYNMGYTYGNHPYEVDAKKAEEDWKLFV